MMGSLGQAENDTESIAQFMQRLSQVTNIFISPEDPTGTPTLTCNPHTHLYAAAGGLSLIVTVVPQASLESC